MTLNETGLRKAGIVFLLIYAAVGVAAIAVPGGLADWKIYPWNSVGEAILYGLVLLPFIGLFGAGIGFVQRHLFAPLLWISSALTLFMTVGELLEGDSIQPNATVIVLLLAVSVACVVYLLIRWRWFRAKRLAAAKAA